MTTSELVLRAVVDDDLPTFFEFGQDPEALRMAAFTAKDPTDHAAFLAHWARIRGNPAIVMQTIVVEGAVAGHVGCFPQEGRTEVTYWLGRPYWGRGIAARALAAFVAQLGTRPLHAHVAADNRASLRVLEKCGFTVLAHEQGYAEARGAVIDELLLVREG